MWHGARTLSAPRDWWKAMFCANGWPSFFLMMIAGWDIRGRRRASSRSNCFAMASARSESLSSERPVGAAFSIARSRSCWQRNTSARWIDPRSSRSCVSARRSLIGVRCCWRGAIGGPHPIFPRSSLCWRSWRRRWMYLFAIASPSCLRSWRPEIFPCRSISRVGSHGGSSKRSGFVNGRAIEDGCSSLRSTACTASTPSGPSCRKLSARGFPPGLAPAIGWPRRLQNGRHRPRSSRRCFARCTTKRNLPSERPRKRWVSSPQEMTLWQTNWRISRARASVLPHGHAPLRRSGEPGSTIHA